MMPYFDVLVMEDDPASSFVCEFFENYGLKCKLVNTVEDAIKFLKISRWPPKVIVADYMMPRIGGLQFMQKKLAMGCPVPVVMVTGYEFAADELAKAGVLPEHLINKPAPMEDLLTIVNRYCHGAEGNGSASPQ